MKILDVMCFLLGQVFLLPVCAAGHIFMGSRTRLKDHPGHWPLVRLVAGWIGDEEGHTAFPVGQIFSPYAGTSGRAPGCPLQLAQNTERHGSCFKYDTLEDNKSEGKDAKLTCRQSRGDGNH
jgi:hypothetical protein